MDKPRGDRVISDMGLVWLGLTTPAQIGRGGWEMYLGSLQVPTVRRISIMRGCLDIYCHPTALAEKVRALADADSQVKLTLRTPRGTWEQTCTVSRYEEHAEFPSSVTEYSFHLEGIDARRLIPKENPSQ